MVGRKTEFKEQNKILKKERSRKNKTEGKTCKGTGSEKGLKKNQTIGEPGRKVSIPLFYYYSLQSLDDKHKTSLLSIVKAKPQVHSIVSQFLFSIFLTGVTL